MPSISPPLARTPTPPRPAPAASRPPPSTAKAPAPAPKPASSAPKAEAPASSGTKPVRPTHWAVRALLFPVGVVLSPLYILGVVAMSAVGLVAWLVTGSALTGRSRSATNFSFNGSKSSGLDELDEKSASDGEKAADAKLGAEAKRMAEAHLSAVGQAKIAERVTKLLKKVGFLDLGLGKAEAREWLSTFTSMPLGRLWTPSGTRTNVVADRARIERELDAKIVGNAAVKRQLVAKHIMAFYRGAAQGNKPKVLTLRGIAGSGKTRIVREFGRITGRPVEVISLDGANSARLLRGVEPSYKSAEQGKLASALRNAGAMNPIIFLDEVDKIDTSDKGLGLLRVLNHVLDPDRNHTFADDFMPYCNLDLSRVQFILALNDDSILRQLDSLRDRLNMVDMDVLEAGPAKALRLQKIVAESLDEANLNSPVQFDPDALALLEQAISPPARGTSGARTQRNFIEIVLGDVAVQQVCGDWPASRKLVTAEDVRNILGDNLRHTAAASAPTPGAANPAPA